ncbi:hypothetical protein BH09VER1_BH09VER1_40050 [soil metagenome]
MPKKPREIERKFLVKRMPAGYERLRSILIEQGYIVQDNNREVRLRRSGRAYFLTVKDGKGLSRLEVETSISERQFDTLWPLTEERRVSKTRYILPYEGLRIEIDRYLDDLHPLCVAEVEFASTAASKKFDKPGFFGKEVTGLIEYSNAYLAGHGSPPKEVNYRIGALPFLYRRGRLHLVVITNSSKKRWLIPKGQPESRMSRHDVGLMESFEEAGIIGNFLPGIRAQCTLKDKTVLHLYPLQVSTLLKKWPESATRKRAILPLNKALKTITDQSLAQCVQRLCAKLEE